jgi:DNA-binding transcriptional ArsR family regulator
MPPNGGMPDVLRVHLTVKDLLRTKFASRPAPLVELMLAVATLQRREPAFAGWRRSAAARLSPAARPLLELIPASAHGPLFLDPITTNLAEGLELVRATPASFVAEELRRVSAARSPTPPWLRQLAEGDPETWRDLDLALRLAYRDLVEDAWGRVWSGFRSELAWRSRIIAELGVRAALSTLHPRITWNGTVMQIEAPEGLDVYPRGAGMTLLPSPLWPGRPLLAEHADGSTVIIYPAITPLPLIDEATPDPLAGLLGQTRAAILKSAFQERTTTELARELNVSAATVSGHTKTLRAAGLIVTRRAGKAVLHSLTPLGDRLLENAARSPLGTRGEG